MAEHIVQKAATKIRRRRKEIEEMEKTGQMERDGVDDSVMEKVIPDGDYGSKLQLHRARR